LAEIASYISDSVQETGIDGLARTNLLCVPKTSSGDDFGFNRENPLFLNQNSLFRRNNSPLSASTITNG